MTDFMTLEQAQALKAGDRIMVLKENLHPVGTIMVVTKRDDAGIDVTLEGSEEIDSYWFDTLASSFGLAETAVSETDGPWRCFHCNELFTARWTARDHFGHTEDATPACQIKAGEIGLVKALREAEKDAMDALFALQNESSTTAKAWRAMQGRHQQQVTAMEQLGYERGLRDAKAHPEELGLKRIEG